MIPPFVTSASRSAPKRRTILPSLRRGYVFLISVLAIGAISTATAVSMILLGLAAQQSGFALVESAQAWEYANTCIERALQSLRSDPHYVGGQTFTFTSGTCTLKIIGGRGAVNRTLCAEGNSGGSIRRVEVIASRTLPTTVIDTWKEVSVFTLCK
jgi:hypothetical protein